MNECSERPASISCARKIAEMLINTVVKKLNLRKANPLFKTFTVQQMDVIREIIQDQELASRFRAEIVSQEGEQAKVDGRNVQEKIRIKRPFPSSKCDQVVKRKRLGYLQDAKTQTRIMIKSRAASIGENFMEIEAVTKKVLRETKKKKLLKVKLVRTNTVRKMIQQRIQLNRLVKKKEVDA